MNQLDILRQVANTEPDAITELEWVILLAETVSIETRRKAAEELAAKDAQIVAMREAMIMALKELRSTQYNWQEEELFNVNDILESALTAAKADGGG